MKNSANVKNKVAGKIPVIFALVGNSFITVIKFFGFMISGSGSMFSESIHSLADTANQGLLLIGIKRSTRKADQDFSYGYGQERFLWALISACGIFFIGAGVTIYHGMSSLAHPEVVVISPIVFGILTVSFIIETITLLIACKELFACKKKSFFWILKNGDPSTIAVFYEDSVAVLGVAIAFFSILLTEKTGNYLWDALGSIVIGILLGIVAVVLINKNRKYLIKKSIPAETKKRIIKIMESDPMIEKVLDFKSSVLDVGAYQIKCEVEFNGSALARKLYQSDFIKEEYEILKEDYSEFIRFLSEYADRVPRLIGREIDDIEDKIKKELPEIKHIDIEIN
jgi:zinc transporter 9